MESPYGHTLTTQLIHQSREASVHYTSWKVTLGLSSIGHIDILHCKFGKQLS